MKTTSAILVLAAITGVASGCASADDSSASSGSDIVVNVDDVVNKVTVKDDSLVFDADLLSQLQEQLTKVDAYAAADDKTSVEPVFFIGNRESDAKGADGSIKEGIRNPTGYLRRATSWSKASDGTIVVMTEQATIADASDELLSGRVTGLSTSSLKTQSTPPAGTGGKTWTYEFGGKDGFTPIDLSGKVLWQKKLLSGGNMKLSLAKGSINIKPKIDAALLMAGHLPQSGSAVITTDVDGEIEFDADADGSFDMSAGDTLYTKQFGGLLTSGLATGLPLTMQVDVKWSCAVGASGKVHAAVGASAKGSLTAGAQFEGKTLSAIFPTPTYSFTPVGPSLSTNVTVKGECHLISTVALQVFDAVGPNASVDLYANVAVDGTQQDASGNVTGALTLGVQSAVGGGLKPFGFTIATISATPFKFEQTFSQSLQVGGQPAAAPPDPSQPDPSQPDPSQPDPSQPDPNDPDNNP